MTEQHTNPRAGFSQTSHHSSKAHVHGSELGQCRFSGGPFPTTAAWLTPCSLSGLPFKSFPFYPLPNHNQATWMVSLSLSFLKAGEDHGLFLRLRDVFVTCWVRTERAEYSLLCLECCRNSWSLTNHFENCNVVEDLNKSTMDLSKVGLF